MTKEEKRKGDLMTLLNQGANTPFNDSDIDIVSLTNMASLVDLAQKAFGKDVVFFRNNAPEKLGVDGVMGEGTNLMFINAESSVAAQVVFGHELMHHLAEDMPETYEGFKTSIIPLLEENQEFRNWISDRSRYKQEHIVDEVIADFVSENLTNQGFWKELAENSLKSTDDAIAKADQYFKATIGSQDILSDTMMQSGVIEQITDLKSALVAAKTLLLVYKHDRVKSKELLVYDMEGFKENTKARFLFFGVNAKNHNSALLGSFREHLEAKNRDQNELRQITGWFRLKDTKDRFEVSDKNSFFIIPNLVIDETIPKINHAISVANDDIMLGNCPRSEGEVFLAELGRTKSLINQILDESKKADSGTLGHYLYHPALYENYPDIRKTPIVAWDGGDGQTIVENGQPKILVNIEYFKSLNREVLLNTDLLETVLHEVQHVIQFYEGFGAGASQQESEEMVQGLLKNDSIAYTTNLYNAYKEETNPDVKKALKARFDLAVDRHRRNEFLERGGQSAGYEVYRKTLGEVEAEDVVRRRTLNDHERNITTPDALGRDYLFVTRVGESDRSQPPQNPQDQNPFRVIEDDRVSGVIDPLPVKQNKDNRKKNSERPRGLGRMK